MHESVSVPETSVEVSLRYVRNRGNYENVTVQIGVRDFVRSNENTSTATDRIYSFVEKKLIEKMNEIESDLKK